MLLLLLLMPVMLLVMLRGLEHYERLIDRPTRAPASPPSPPVEDAAAAELEPERAGERAPGFAPEPA